jgi:hypothetical protein
LDEAGAGVLNRICYMWWEVFPAAGQPGNAGREALNGEFLAVMKRILALDSIACQESALDGLGHWQMYYPKTVAQTIDEFVAHVRNARQELRDYANCARQGRVQ